MEQIQEVTWTVLWPYYLCSLFWNRYIPRSQKTQSKTEKLSSTESYNRSILKPSRLISRIQNWLDIPKVMQLDWPNNMTVSSTLSAIFMARWLPKISLMPPSPGMTPAIWDFKWHCRYLEGVWCRSPTELNRSRLTRQTHLCNRQMSKAKSAHYSKLIAEHSGDHGSLWKAFNKILHCCPKMHLPDHSSIISLAKHIQLVFSLMKSPSIRSSLPPDSLSRVSNPPDIRKVLQNLSCVTVDEIRRLVLQAPCK